MVALLDSCARGVRLVSSAWPLWGLTASFTCGCVRELTDLTFEASPALADASLFDASPSDAATKTHALSNEYDANAADATFPIGARLDAGRSQDASQTATDAGNDEHEWAPDAGTVTSSTAAASVDPEAGVPSVDASADAGLRGEDWVFGVASPVPHGNAGLAVAPLFPASGVVVDGSSSEWSEHGWLWVATPDPGVGLPQSELDLSATLSLRWDNTRLYLAVVVRDDTHVNDAGGYDIWEGDSIQVAFDVEQGRSPYDWEYGFANTSRGLVAHRWRDGDADLTKDMQFAVVRYGAITMYEVAFEARHLGVTEFPSTALRLSVAVNDNDGEERRAALELVSGIVGSKTAEHFAATSWQP